MYIVCKSCVDNLICDLIPPIPMNYIELERTLMNLYSLIWDEKYFVCKFLDKHLIFLEKWLCFVKDSWFFDFLRAKQSLWDD